MLAADSTTDELAMNKGGQIPIVVFCDAHLYCLAQEDEEVSSVLARASKCYADGRSVRIVTGWEYMTGTDYFLNIMSATKQNGWTHYFYGASEPVLQELERIVVSQWGALVVGRFSPDIKQVRHWPVESEVLQSLADASVDYFWVFLGGGKQEVWASRNYDCIPAVRVPCVGAVASFVTGNVRRAPKILRVLGLEWLFRTSSEGRQRARRNTKYLMRMTTYIAAAILRRRAYMGRSFEK